MSFILNDVDAMIYSDSSKHNTLEIPTVRSPFEEVEEHLVLAVSLHKDGHSLVTIQTPEGPVAYLLPKDTADTLTGWVRNMLALSHDGVASFPVKVTFGKYRDKYFAHTN